MPYNTLAVRYKSKLFNLTGLRELSEKTIKTYWGLRNLTALKDVVSCSQEYNEQMLSYSDMLERVERQVVNIVQSEPILSSSENLLIYRLFGNAALLHIYMFMRDLPRGLPFFHMLSNRIRQLLEVVDIERLQMQYPEMVLWILIMGGLGGNGTPNRSWFASELAEACEASGVRGGNEVAFTLAEFIWTELYRSPVTMGFWNDVTIAQGIGWGYEVRRLTDHVSAQTFNAPPEIMD
jgi:hypothetical protein